MKNVTAADIRAEYDEDELFENESGYRCRRDEAIQMLLGGQIVHTVTGDWEYLCIREKEVK